jgi:hypothetical protein
MTAAEMLTGMLYQKMTIQFRLGNKADPDLLQNLNKKSNFSLENYTEFLSLY